MKKLKELVEQHQANTRPVDPASIQNLEQQLGFALSGEYRDYLQSFGVIVFDAYETYGLGVPEDHYLNALVAWGDLSRDPNYPRGTVPLLDIGDGQYYLYDNESQKVLVWATPNGGVVRTLDDGLEEFLIQHVFGK